MTILNSGLTNFRQNVPASELYSAISVYVKAVPRTFYISTEAGALPFGSDNHHLDLGLAEPTNNVSRAIVRSKALQTQFLLVSFYGFPRLPLPQIPDSPQSLFSSKSPILYLCWLDEIVAPVHRQFQQPREKQEDILFIANQIFVIMCTSANSTDNWVMIERLTYCLSLSEGMNSLRCATQNVMFGIINDMQTENVRETLPQARASTLDQHIRLDRFPICRNRDPSSAQREIREIASWHHRDLILATDARLRRFFDANPDILFRVVVDVASNARTPR
ncbi:hypothetical protein CC78DRAFT_575152 [Lojkania enalia]|uniref:Uncharacterized protein n=1 Tax=Lojkania enalia TaxID=147567 RepID=A0A9P4NAH0_9PLEO|nr:hypothetical protein CC78DRAFT_575152 [Didymosphaeria enalia]